MVEHPGLLNDTGKILNKYPGGHYERWPDAQKNMIDSFYRTILDGSTGNFATFKDAHRIMNMIDAVIKSNTTGTWQKIKS